MLYFTVFQVFFFITTYDKILLPSFRKFIAFLQFVTGWISFFSSRTTASNRSLLGGNQF